MIGREESARPGAANRGRSDREEATRLVEGLWISETANGFLLEAEQVVPRIRDEVFPFFADASNLETLTPPWLGFRILTPRPILMRPGTIIDYRISLRGIPMRWRTLISTWEPPYRFVDEQLRGPYARWVHEHTFDEVPGGTLCRDRVSYALPVGGQLGRWAHTLFVRRDLERIFAYRRAKMRLQWN